MPKTKKPADRKAPDSDTPLQGKEFFARAVNVSALMPDLAEHAQAKRAPGRPTVAKPKVAVSLRLDPDVLVGFKSTGKGWQTRISDALAATLRNGYFDPAAGAILRNSKTGELVKKPVRSVAARKRG
jgi:uncharacterized protein (DUF4415 family)